MSAFIDARCPKCGRKISWFGRLKDRPPCACGHTLPQEELEAADKEMDAIEERVLAKRKARDERKVKDGQ